jgi:hypothetical protein
MFWFWQHTLIVAVPKEPRVPFVFLTKRQFSTTSSDFAKMDGIICFQGCEICRGVVLMQASNVDCDVKRRKARSFPVLVGSVSTVICRLLCYSRLIVWVTWRLEAPTSMSLSDTTGVDRADCDNRSPEILHTFQLERNLVHQQQKHSPLYVSQFQSFLGIHYRCYGAKVESRDVFIRGGCRFEVGALLLSTQSAAHPSRVVDYRECSRPQNPTVHQ